MNVRHSQAYVVIVFLLGIVLVGFAISVLMEPLGTVYNGTYNKTSVQDDSYQQFFTRSQTIWVWLPVVLAFGLIFWALMKGHERQGGYG